MFLSEKENAVQKNNIGKYSEFSIINTEKHVLSETGSLSLVYSSFERCSGGDEIKVCVA